MSEQREIPGWTRCTRCHQLTGIINNNGKCPGCIAATSNFGSQPADPHDACNETINRLRDQLQEVKESLGRFKCQHISRVSHQATEPIDWQGWVDCVMAKETTRLNGEIEARDETIRARDEAIARYSRDLRVAERQIEEMRRVQYDLEEERDEWKARAEDLEEDKASYERLAWRWYDEARKFERRLSALVSAHWSTSSSTLHMTGNTHTTAMSLRGTPYCYCGGRWHRIGGQG